VTEEFASEETFGQAAAVSRRRSQDPRPDRARGGAGPGRVVMGWSGAPVPPLKAAQGQRVVEKGADVASPHCGPLPRPRSLPLDRLSVTTSHDRIPYVRHLHRSNFAGRDARLPPSCGFQLMQIVCLAGAWRGHVTLHLSKYLRK
jgi:hypothetical protein